MMLAGSVLVFISYSHADRTAANELRRELIAAGCAVWMDTGIRGGSDWTRAIERAIDRADVVISLLSPSSYDSAFVRAEQLRAIRKGKRLIPVALSATDVPLAVEPLQQVRSVGDAARAAGCRNSRVTGEQPE